MLIVFGTRFCGKIAEHNDQWIESKFFSIMFVPIFPLSSMFVTRSEFRRRQGFNMDMNNRSVMAAYGRVYCPLLALLFLWLADEAYSEAQSGMFLIFLVVGLAMAALSVYFYFFYGNAKPEDIPMRDKVGALTGFYALPHWLDYSYQTTALRAFEAQYKKENPDGNWKTDLRNDNVARDKGALFFGLALFNCMVNDTPENDELYAIADALFPVKSESAFS